MRGRREGKDARRRPSLREIAKLTGFSTTTVSMVLNGRAEEFAISARTRDRIRAAVREHQYHPNLHARSLRRRTTDLLGLMVPTLSNPFFAEMAETFERLAREAKKVALVTVTRYDAQEELDTLGWFLSQKVECVFTANPMALAAVSSLCSRAGTRQILLDAQDSPEPTVSTDNREAGEVLTRNLLASLRAAGRPGRVYFVGGMADHRITQERLAGFKAALAAAGASFTRDQFIPTRFEGNLACRELRALFARRDDVGGLFLNALPALEGLVQLYPEAPGRFREAHYGVFDYHPIMTLLADLRIVIVKQDPAGMMRRAYELFVNAPETAAAKAGRAGRTHHVPYELVLTPGMRTFLPAPLKASDAGVPESPRRPAARGR